MSLKKCHYLTVNLKWQSKRFFFILLTLIFLLKHNFTFCHSSTYNVFCAKMLLISCSSEMGGDTLENASRVYELMNHSQYFICLFNIFCTNTQMSVEMCLKNAWSYLVFTEWITSQFANKQTAFLLSSSTISFAHLLWINLCKSFLAFFNCQLIAHNSGGSELELNKIRWNCID